MEDNFRVSWTIFSSSLSFFTAYSIFYSTDYSFSSLNSAEKPKVIKERESTEKHLLCNWSKTISV